MNLRGCDRRLPPATPSDRGRPYRHDTGAAAVEMALVLPLLLLLLFGIIDFGRMLNTQITLTEAAREGARAVALGLEPEPVVAAATTGLPLDPIDPIECDETVTEDDSDPYATVELSHAFEAITPLGAVMGLFGGTTDGSVTLTAKGVMPCVG